MTLPPLANCLKAQLAAGEPTFGVIVTVPSVAIVQTPASAGVDWLVLDMEHASVGPEALHAMIAATAGTRTAALVRLPWSNPWHAKLPLDLGAMGIVFPMVRTRQDAENAVRAVKYPPKGGRSWGPFYAPMRWAIPMPEYIASANANVLAIATRRADAQPLAQAEPQWQATRPGLAVRGPLSPARAGRPAAGAGSART